MRSLLSLLGAALVGTLLLFALLWWRQEKLIFLPAPLPPGHRFGFGPDVHETWIEADGARLHALHLRLPRPDGVVFYLHGNAGNLDGWFADVEFYRRLNLDLFMPDYRGYGKSGGRIASEAQLHADVRAAWDAMQAHYAAQVQAKAPAPLRRVVVGHSIGSGPATRLALAVQPERLLLISPYTSLRALAAEVYAWVPSALLRYPLPTGDWIAEVTVPIVLLHGERDEIIGADHSRRLQTLATRSPRVQLLIVPGAGHNDLAAFTAYREGLAVALQGR